MYQKTLIHRQIRNANFDEWGARLGVFVAANDKAEQVKHLLRSGKTGGYVLYDEIDQLLPAGYEGGPELDEILSELARNNIEVLEELRPKREGEFNANDKTPDENGFLQKLDQESGEDSALRMYLREVLTVPTLTREQEIDLAKRVCGGVQDAENAERQLIEANLRLVFSTAKRYRHLDRSAIDLIQEGNIGLMKAVKKFDYTRGYRFSTYAIWWVRPSIIRDA